MVGDVQRWALPRYEKELEGLQSKRTSQAHLGMLDARLPPFVFEPDHIFMLSFSHHIYLYALYYLDRPPLSSA